jgi:hypothetical protein
MNAEVLRFFEYIFIENRPVAELLSARLPFVDASLASHYGLPAPGGTVGQMKQTDLSMVPRMGLITMGAVLTATSHSDGTSPVKRGQFVLDNLMCQPVPPPPPEAQAEIEKKMMMQPPGAAATTWREQLEEHRRNPQCAGCHRLMDPIGLGLENYDAVGQYRTMDRRRPIDPSGDLPDGTRFSGALELAGMLAKDPRFTRCLTRKLATFMIGRRLSQPEDEGWLDHLTAASGPSGASGASGAGGASAGSVKDSLRILVMSEAFRSRRGRGPAAAR